MKLLTAFTTILLASLLGSLLLTGSVQASTLGAYQQKTTQKVGESRLTWFIWDVYNAALFTPTGNYTAGQPFVLELTYLRALDSQKVAAKTTEEMARLGYKNAAKLAQWQLLLTDWFGTINKGTRLAGMRNADGSTSFIRNGKQLVGTITDPDFTRYFFAIWLGDNTLRPELHQQLLGKEKVATR
jgi:Trk-type K+ transport system membrane component